MIVIDNFIKDRALLNEIDNDDTFFGPNGNFMWWDGWWNSTANTCKKRLIEYLWRYHSPAPSYNNISGFEYWTGVYGDGFPNTDLGWHFDKDEELWKRTGGKDGGELVLPEVGTVYYPKDTEFEGGYLEIERANGEVERIEPKYNRLVIFDAGGVRHRVTSVKNGVRYAIAINLWSKVPVLAQEGNMTIEEPKLPIVHSERIGGVKGGLK